jgi:signal transduction histidine kinase
MSSEPIEKTTRLVLMTLRREQDVVQCRNRARTIAAAFHFDRHDQVRIATAVSEIARNAFCYATGATVEFSLAQTRTSDNRRSVPSFVVIVRDRGSGIGNLPSILAGTYQSKSGMGMGILAAKRLMDDVLFETNATGTVVRLVRELPKGTDLTGLDLQSIARDISRTSQAELLEELAAQNQELIATLDQLNSQRLELQKINDELSETNRGVVALFDELDTVQRVGRVVASKLDLTDLLQAITDATVEVSGAECGGFFRKEPQAAEFTCQTVSGPLGIALENASLVDVDELVDSGNDQPIVRIDDLAAAERGSPLRPQWPVRSFLALGVRNSTGEIAGALAFAHRSPGVFTERTERILAIVAVQLSIGLENAQLYRSARAASAAKDQFLAILSHELRTPLTPIFAILASIDRNSELPEEIRSDLLVINRNLQLEARLIDDLLDITRINKGKISLMKEVIDLHNLIRSVRQLCQVAIDAQQVQFELQLEAPLYHVLGDAGRLQQVLWNIFSNAIKFTPAGGTIVLRTFVIAGNEICVRLTDTGRGIDWSSLETIFQPFEQGDVSVAPQFGGLGLGLAIAKAIVDAHQGRILAESLGAGLGSTFTVTLPLTESQASQKEQLLPAKTASHDRAVRILLVDDHEDTLEFMSRFLTLCGHQVATAATYQNALRLSQEQQFDLLLSDLGLPDGDGYQLIRVLQAASPIKGIALSGYGMNADVQASLAAGFSAHLTKPCDLSLLSATIGTVVSW